MTIDNIKLVLGIAVTDTSKDILLTYLLNITERKALNYCNQTETPIGLEPIIEEWVVIRYNKLGSEGLQSESYSGISQTFLTDIPSDIKTQLNAFRRLKSL